MLSFKDFIIKKLDGILDKPISKEELIKQNPHLIKLINGTQTREEYANIYVVKNKDMSFLFEEKAMDKKMGIVKFNAWVRDSGYEVGSRTINGIIWYFNDKDIWEFSLRDICAIPLKKFMMIKNIGRATANDLAEIQTLIQDSNEESS